MSKLRFYLSIALIQTLTVITYSQVTIVLVTIGNPISESLGITYNV